MAAGDDRRLRRRVAVVLPRFDIGGGGRRPPEFSGEWIGGVERSLTIDVLSLKISNVRTITEVNLQARFPSLLLIALRTFPTPGFVE